MRSSARLIFALLALAAAGAQASDWQLWERCELVADQYYDGDSFQVRHRGVVTIIRLYFVDAPECDDRYHSLVADQAERFKVGPGTVLIWGERAKAFTSKFLSGSFQVRTRMQPALGASRSQRYYGIVEARGQRLDSALIDAGLARVSGTVADFPNRQSGDKVVRDLRTRELQAAKARRGIWALANGEIERPSDARKPRLGKNAGAVGTLSRVNINAASAEELEALPGIGPKTAQVMIRARPIKNLEALDAIPGFGPKTIEALRDLIRFE